MLTKQYLKDNFIDAYFINEGRDTIEILTTSEDKKEVFPTIIPFNEEHEGFKTLVSKMSVDDLHERPYGKKKDERKAFEEQLIRIAKRDGLVFDEAKVDTKFFPTLVKAITDNPDNEDHLFSLKLALFEVDKIRESDNADLKSVIRKSKTKAEALLNALKIILE